MRFLLFFIQKSLFIDGLLPSLRLKVYLKKHKTFEDVVKVAREKEWKIQRLKELNMYLNDEVRPVKEMHVKLVPACDGNGYMQEPQRPKQVKPGMYYVPSNFFPEHEAIVQVKEDAKQVNQEENAHKILMQLDIKQVDDAHVNPCVESEFLDVETMFDEDATSLASFSGEGRQVDTVEDMYAICMQEDDLEYSTNVNLDLDIKGMHALEIVDLVDIAHVSVDKVHKDIEYMAYLDQDSSHNLTMKENGVETFMQVDEDVLVYKQGSPSDEEEVIFTNLQDVLDYEDSLYEADTKGVGKSQDFVHVVFEDKEIKENKVHDLDAIKDDVVWDIPSLDEQETAVDMDVGMSAWVAKALLKAKQALLLEIDKPIDDLRITPMLDEGFNLVGFIGNANENDVLLHANLFALEPDILEGHAYVIGVQSHEETIVPSVWLKCLKRMIFDLGIWGYLLQVSDWALSVFAL